MSPVTVSPFTPSQGRTTCLAPPRALSTTRLTMAAGTANPTPAEEPEREKIAVLMPIRSPSMSTSAPPELPGLMAASVWMKEPLSEMPVSVRFRAEMMPLVTVWPTPNGLPMARTRSPTCCCSRSSMASTGSRSLTFSSLSTAMSLRSSARMTVAGNSRRSFSTTLICWAPWMTWLLVTTIPSERTITPDPTDSATRAWGMPPPNSWKKGSACTRCTLRAEILTTAGAAERTTGAKLDFMPPASLGTFRVGWANSPSCALDG